MKSLNILNSSLLQANNWWCSYKNMEEKMVMFYLLQQNISFELHIIQILNVEAIFFAIGWSQRSLLIWYS